MYKTWGKITIFLLLIIGILVLGGGLIGYFSTEANSDRYLNYGSNKEEVIENMLQAEINVHIEQQLPTVYSMLMDIGFDIEAEEHKLEQVLPNTKYRIWYDEELVASNYEREEYVESRESTEILTFYLEDGTYQDVVVKMELFFLDGFLSEDFIENHTANLKEEYESWEQIASYQNYFLGGAIVAGILSLVLLILSIVVAGRTEEKEIHLNAFDKIPLDIIGAVWLVMLAIGASAMGDGALLGVVMLGLCVLLASATFLSFCARVKAGKWWRNILIVKAVTWIWKKVKLLSWFLKEDFIHTKMLRQALIIIIGVTVVEGMLILVWFGGWGDIYVVALWMLIFIGNAALSISWLLVCKNFQYLKDATIKVVNGDINHKIDTTTMIGEYQEFAEAINRIGTGMNHAMEERIKSERLKSELITNVSHDIKTPLTSIINYVDLIKKADCENGEVNEYIEVLDRQSQKLKKLITDLVEASKISSGNIKINLEKTDLCVMVRQLEGEFLERLEKAELELVVSHPERPVYVMADGRQMQRICDNLMNNILKYSMNKTRVYLTVEEKSTAISLTFRNMSKEKLNINPSELMERFVRGDESRNTEGNGLGLSIADSLAQAQGADMEIVIDGDLFKVVIEFTR